MFYITKWGQGQKGVLPSPRGMLGQCARSPGGAETRRPGPGARHAERKGPATARGTAPAGTDGARACARACAPPPGLGSARAASCAGLSPLRRTWGEATLAWFLAEEAPFPPATPINKPHRPRVPGALQPPWAGVLPAPSRPARARRPRPRLFWRSRARLAAPLRSARSPLLAFPVSRLPIFFSAPSTGDLPGRATAHTAGPLPALLPAPASATSAASLSTASAS